MDILNVLEAAYQIDAPDEVWLSGLARAAKPHLDRGFGLSVFEFFRPPNGLPVILQSCTLDVPDGLAKIQHVVFSTMDPDIRMRPFLLGPCVSGSQMMGMREEFHDQPHMKRFAQQFGVFDTIWITAMEPSGRGCGIHAGRAQVGWPSATLRRRWGQVAAHLANAVRLRRRLHLQAALGVNPESSLEAVFDSKGNACSAIGPAKEQAALDALRTAVLTVEALRGPLRLSDPDMALYRWKGLVNGRWSLIDQTDHDGRRYIVARENTPPAPGSESLTARERQIVAYARLGHHNKLIAYELGISHSTVRVLMSRAMKRLGLRSRRDLVRAAVDGVSPSPQGS